MVAGLLLSGVVLWNSSQAVFTDTTTNPGNDWSTGSVTLDDNRNGVTIWNNVTGLVPGSTATQCIEVIFNGTLASNVYLYAANYSAGADIGNALTLTVAIGSGSSCGTFGTSTQVFSTSIATFGAKTAYNTGYLTHAISGSPVTPPVTRPFNITYLLADDNGAQGETTAIDFVWEARNT